MREFGENCFQGFVYLVLIIGMAVVFSNTIREIPGAPDPVWTCGEEDAACEEQEFATYDGGIARCKVVNDKLKGCIVERPKSPERVVLND